MKRVTKAELADVFRLAARLIEKRKNFGRGACAAIHDARGTLGVQPDLDAYDAYDSKAHKIFGRYFPWNELPSKGGITFYHNDDEMDLRVVALCFCAAIVEAG